jgi:hypothetical protein
VVRKLDPDHTDEDFLRDLDKATSDEARKRLGLPSAPDRGSAKTSELDESRVLYRKGYSSR